MATRKLQPTNRIELDFTEAELTLEILPANEPELEWDDDGADIAINVSNGKTVISPQSFEDEYSIVLKMPDTTAVGVKCIVGSINIEHPWKGDIAIECSNDIELDCDEVGLLAVKCETGSIDINSVSDLTIATQDADITVAECTKTLSIVAISSEVEIDSGANLDIKTVSGDIDVGTAEKIKIQTLSGDINIEETGDCDIESTSGDMEINAVSGNLRIKSISSEIAIGELTTEKAVIEDVSGTVEIDTLMIKEGAMSIKTVSDDVRIGIHEDCSAIFKLKSSAGEIATPDEAESGIFTVSQGTAEVTITTVSGAIEIE